MKYHKIIRVQISKGWKLNLEGNRGIGKHFVQLNEAHYRMWFDSNPFRGCKTFVICVWTLMHTFFSYFSGHHSLHQHSEQHVLYINTMCNLFHKFMYMFICILMYYVL